MRGRSGKKGRGRHDMTEGRNNKIPSLGQVTTATSSSSSASAHVVLRDQPPRPEELIPVAAADLFVGHEQKYCQMFSLLPAKEPGKMNLKPEKPDLKFRAKGFN